MWAAPVVNAWKTKYYVVHIGNNMDIKQGEATSYQGLQKGEQSFVQTFGGPGELLYVEVKD